MLRPLLVLALVAAGVALPAVSPAPQASAVTPLLLLGRIGRMEDLNDQSLELLELVEKLHRAEERRQARDYATGLALAELTGLAGDHAAAAGRLSNAKWLWRLALKRFGEAGALNSPAARQVSERLRLAGQ